LSGFADVFAAAGYPIPASRVLVGDFTFDGGRDAVSATVSSGTDFDAVFAHNDLSAAGAIQALRDAGVKVPHDVAVVGFDDIPLAVHTDPTLTTVRQPLHEMGRTAARILLARFAGLHPEENRCVLPTTLVVRGSSVAA
jgi:LacI family transcriptional regulator